MVTEGIGGGEAWLADLSHCKRTCFPYCQAFQLSFVSSVALHSAFVWG